MFDLLAHWRGAFSAVSYLYAMSSCTQLGRHYLTYFLNQMMLFQVAFPQGKGVILVQPCSQGPEFYPGEVLLMSSCNSMLIEYFRRTTIIKNDFK